MTRVRQDLALICLCIIRHISKVREKVFVLLIKKGFWDFGKKSSLGLPITLWCPQLISIGAGVYIGPSSWLQVTRDLSRKGDRPVLLLMDDVSITGDCFISAHESVVIEKSVLMGRFVHISDHSHRFDDLERPVKVQGITKASPVRICEGAWLGQGVVVCPGVTIGKNSIIGANSVVKEDVPSYCVAGGAPARVVRRLKE